ARSRPRQRHGRRAVVPRAVAQRQGREHRAHPLRRARHGARGPRGDRGAGLPLLSARPGIEAGLEGDDAPVRPGPVARPRGAPARPTPRAPPTLFRPPGGPLSFGGPAANEKVYREYVSAPANPVPYRQRPISPTYPAGDWRTWEVADQRFVDNRPDVLTYTSA